MATFKAVPGWWDAGRYHMPIDRVEADGHYTTGYWFDATSSSSVVQDIAKEAMAFAAANGVDAAAERFPLYIHKFERAT